MDFALSERHADQLVDLTVSQVGFHILDLHNIINYYLKCIQAMT